MMPLFELDDEDPPADGWSKWGLGAAIPSLMGLYGISCILAQHAILSRRHHVTHLFGQDAIAHGILLVAVSLFLYARYHMPHSKSTREFAGLVKVVAFAIGIVASGFLLLRRAALI